jgi:hypothetical protein
MSTQESLSLWVSVADMGGTGTSPNTAALVKGFIAALCLILGPLDQSDRDG